MVNSKGDIIFGNSMEVSDARQMRRKEAERTYRKKATAAEQDVAAVPPPVSVAREGVRERRSRISTGDLDEVERGAKRDRSGAVKATQIAPAQTSNVQIEQQEPPSAALSFKLERELMFGPKLDGGYYPVDPVSLCPLRCKQITLARVSKSNYL